MMYIDRRHSRLDNDVNDDRGSRCQSSGVDCYSNSNNDNGNDGGDHARKK